MKSIFAALVLALLAGCSAQQATIRPTATSQEFVGSDQGAVALRLTVSSPTVGFYFSFWNELALKSKDADGIERWFEVSRSNLGAVGSATYFGALPAGEYQIETLSSKSCGTICITSSVRFRGSGPTFMVEKGKITYLGNVIYANFGEKRSGLFSRPVSDQGNFLHWLQTYYPNFATMPLSSETGNFKRSELAYRMTQDFTYGYLHGVALPNGSVLFHNLSGSLSEVSWPARVRTINTGMNSRINALLPLSGQHWVVAGDFKEARETLDGGRTWRDAKLNLPDGQVYGLYKGKNDDLLAFIAENGVLGVYAGQIGGTWTRLGGDKYAFSAFLGGIAFPEIQADDKGNSLLVQLPGSPSYRLDTRTYVRTYFEFPGGIMHAAVSGDDVIRCRCNKSGLWVSTWESRDGGKSWQDSELARTLPLPHFYDKLTGFNTKESGLVRTTDGGKTWRPVYKQEQPYWPYPLSPYFFKFVFGSQERIVATDTLGTLIASEDSGMSWKAVQYSR